MIGPDSPQLHFHPYPMPRNTTQRRSGLSIGMRTGRTVVA